MKTFFSKLSNRVSAFLAATGLIAFMTNLYSQFTYDAATLLRAVGAAITATETGSIILDVGNGLLDARLVVDVTALDVASADEYYTFVLQGSPDATFGTAANIAVLASLTIGSVTGANVGTVGGAQGALDVIGRFVIPCRNERNGTTYRYMRLKTVLGGTTPSLTFSAFLGKDD